MSATTERKEEELRQRVAARDFADRDVIEYLDGWSEDAMWAKFGRPIVTTTYAEVPGWRQGDPRPVLASEDPAVMCAVGRCASWRQRERLPGPAALPGWVHPAGCGWCTYPLDALLGACSWSVWLSRHVVSETLGWVGANGSRYIRGGRHDVFEHPAWAAFADLDPPERAIRVAAAVEASRA